MNLDCRLRKVSGKDDRIYNTAKIMFLTQMYTHMHFDMRKRTNEFCHKDAMNHTHTKQKNRVQLFFNVLKLG